MEIRLFNSMKNNVEPVALGHPGRLTLYTCGPTVYTYAHIGNFRSFITGDLIRRVAEITGLKVNFVSNITDVGHLTDDEVADSQGRDKMERALTSKEGELFPTIWDLARHYTEAFEEDWNMLNLRPVSVRPRATEHISEQIAIIERLLASGNAYRTSSAVYFDINSFPKYGMLSGNVVAEDLLRGVRDVVQDREKKDPRDFALWKCDDNHLMKWFSPFGWGYPGWHIECTAMAIKYLGNTIDIHTGGIDNKFPHHECEVAQADAALDKSVVSHWVHTGHLNVEGRRMAKSEGNFFTVRQLLRGEVDPRQSLIKRLGLRYTLISAKYRDPFNFTMKTFDDCQRHVARLNDAWIRSNTCRHEEDDPSDPKIEPILATFYSQALDAMLDDLNAPVALSFALQAAKAVNAKQHWSKNSAESAVRWLSNFNDLLGVVFADDDPLPKKDSNESPDSSNWVVERLLARRKEARANGDYDTADKIRDLFSIAGLKIRDTPGGAEIEEG